MASLLNAQEKMNTIEANSLKMKVKEQANSTKTISSDFTQYKHLDFLSNDIITTGKLAFKTPNLVKWEYVEPFKYSVLFKDETLYINDEGNKSNFDVGSSKMFKQLNKLIINSIKGDMFDDNEFDSYSSRRIQKVKFILIQKTKNFQSLLKLFKLPSALKVR
jgi:outer membrane lipoprotein-sorting protein